MSLGDKILFIIYIVGVAVGGYYYYKRKRNEAKTGQKSDCLTEEEKKVAEFIDMIINRFIAALKKNPILLIPVAVLVLFILVGIVKLKDILTYKDFTTKTEIIELKNMDCDDLLAKNLGVEREFCGNVDDGFVWVNKKDLYNSSSQYCCNPSQESSDLYCGIPIGMFDNRHFATFPNNGIYRFQGTITRDCDYRHSFYCLQEPWGISPADKRTRERMGR